MRYIEFVPDDELPNVLLSALEEKVLRNPTTEKSNQFNVEDIVSILGRMQQTGSVTMTEPVLVKNDVAVTETVEEVAETKLDNVIQFEQVANNFADDDDDDDFMDLMK